MLTRDQLAETIARMPDAPVGVVLEELSRQDPVLWCMFYRRLRGHPLTFDNSKQLTDAALEQTKTEIRDPDRYLREVQARLLRHRPFIMQPMSDTHPWKVYEKARQIGISETSISEVIHFLWTNPTTKWIYTFPRDTQLRDFSTTRIAEAFAETPRMRALLGTPNQIYTKKIGEAYLILRSAWESNLGEGIDADGVTLDEKDRMKEGVEVAFRESMKSSKFGFLREVSTPTLPGRGVDASFKESDQQVWLMRCRKCSLEQEISWPENIVQQFDYALGTKELPAGCYEYQCRRTKCRGMIDRIHGRWVARYPDKKNIRGYHMPQTIAPWITATRLMQNKIDYKFIQLWTNYCLGLPAISNDVLLSDADYDNSCSGHQLILRRTRDWHNISVGIDWGHLNWVVVIGQSTHNNLFYLLNLGVFEDNYSQELESVKDIEKFIAPYEPDRIIADAGFGKDRNAYLMRKYSPRGIGRFYSCQYNPSTKHSRTFQPVWSAPDQGRLLVDRTMSIKVVCRAIKEREFGIPDLGLEKAMLWKRHFKNLAPLRVEEDGEIVEDISHTGDDHLVHATVYAWLGIEHITKGGRFSFDFLG